MRSKLRFMREPSELLAEIERRIIMRRKTMNYPDAEPALRYMAAGAFEELRSLRAHTQSGESHE
jgi:hypothetical protein